MASVALTDTHCHLDLERFDPDRDQVIERACEAGVSHMLVPALDLDSARRIIALTEKHARLWAAVGYHPTQISHWRSSSLEAVRRLAAADKVVAIGEIGLDYYWVSEQARRLEQRAALVAQLELAQECGLPVILHLREQDDQLPGACADDMLAILEDWVQRLQAHKSPLASRPGVLHSFAGTGEMAEAVIKLGFCLGVTGPITYPNAEKRRQVVSHLPLERLLIETDSPFLAPQQQRGRRNEPAFVTHIADRIAQVVSRTPREVAETTTRNAARLFAWRAPE